MKINIFLVAEGRGWQIRVEGDGPGLTAQQIQDFGQRRSFQRRHQSDGQHNSLGLGSVIMKAIVELHGGHLEISNQSETLKNSGACLKIQLPATK